MEKMKAWIFEEYKDADGNIRGDSVLKEIDKPVAGPDDAILKINVASICGGDVDCFKHGGANHKVFSGKEWGHEMSATIVELGENVKDLKIGDRVWPYPFFCEPNGMKAGALGGFSEYVLVQNAKKNFNLFSLDGVSDLQGALLEPFLVGFHAANNAKPAPGKKAVVFGCGMIGMAAAVTLANRGCDEVVIVGRRQPKIKNAQALGFKTVSVLDENWRDQLRDILGAGRAFSGQAVDAMCWVEASADDDIINEIIPLMPAKATLTIVAAHEKPVYFHSPYLTFAELTIIGSPAFHPADVPQAIEMMKTMPQDLTKLCNFVCKQEDLKKGYELMRDGEITKAVIDYTGKLLK